MGLICDFEVLSILLNAASKDVVKATCEVAAQYRDSLTIPDDVTQRVSQQFSVPNLQSKQLLENLGRLIHDAVFLGSSEATGILKLFPSNFHKDLKNLLTKVIMENLTKWKDDSVDKIVSLPRLGEFDWRVDVKVSSDVVTRMSLATCILNLTIEDDTVNCNQTSVNVELSKETLDTMLDGLIKIREQLSSVAQH